MTREGHRVVAESFVLGICLLIVLFIGSLGVGVTWDESIYFRYSDSISQWLATEDPFDPATVEHHWNEYPYWNPHPPFMKILDAATARLFEDVFLFPLNYRLGHFFYVSACVGLVYALLRAAWSLPWALIAICFALLQPRVFGELLIATTDAPTAMAWLILPLVAWRLDQSIAESRPGLRLIFFLVFGFAVATKFTGLLVAVPVAAFFIWRRDFREVLWLAGAVLWSLLFLVLVSPDKWYSPFTAIGDFLFYPFTRPSIPMATIYFGISYPFHLPWHYFAVMTFITYPVLLSLLLAGLPLHRSEDRPLLTVLFFSLGFWILLVHLPHTPKHDGVRQFVSVFPIFGLLSFVGLRGFLYRAGAMARPSLAAAAVGLAVGALALRVWATHPHELSYYNAAIGGIRGAEAAGMEMSYYFESIDLPFLVAINRTVEPGRTIQVIPDWTHLLTLYQDKGLLRRDVSTVSLRQGVGADYLLVLRRRAVVNDDWYRRLEPIYETTFEGVSLAKLVRDAAPTP